MLIQQGEGVAATHQTHIVYGVEMTGDFVAGLIHSNQPTGCHCHHHRRPNDHRSNLRPDLRIGRGWHCLGYAGAEMSELVQALTDPENQPNQYGFECFMKGQKMAFKIGNQTFTLDYEPDETEEFDFMRDMLANAFSTFTPDVNSARIEHLERVLRMAHHAMCANNNCLTTDRPDLPVSPETSWTTDFSKELAAIDEALK